MLLSMENKQKEILSVGITINQSLDLVWDTWVDENHMKYWMMISSDYEVKDAKNDLRIGGGYSYKMCSKIGDIQFDYAGTYIDIELKRLLVFTMNDNRRVEVQFSVIEDVVHVEFHFEAVSEQDFDVQVQGWQAMLVFFKKHVESLI